MSLNYVGNGQYMGGIPAHDLSDNELSEMLRGGVANAVMGRSELSLAEFEGMLIQSGLYVSAIRYEQTYQSNRQFFSTVETEPDTEEKEDEEDEA